MALVALLAFGCSAAVKYTPATDGGTGIRYYQSSPYLLVYSNGKGGLIWQILYLPDQTKMMMVEPKVIGGRSEMTLYFQNGVLTGSTELGDTTELPKAILAAVQSAIPLLAMTMEVQQPTVPAPYLYKIIVEGDKVRFVGGHGDCDIIVPLKETKS
jgi:hypothetical protein